MLAYFSRESGDVLVPACHNAEKYLVTLKEGVGIKMNVTRARNIRFHRKFFKLLRLAFESWEPNPDLRNDGVSVVKDFESFRSHVLILAGHCEAVYGVDGSCQLRAKSIDFDHVDDFQFSDVYSAVLDVVWSRVLGHVRYGSPQQVDHVVNQLMSFG